MRLRWPRDGVLFEAIEPAAELVGVHAPTLRRWYNAADNAPMMGGSGDMTDEDVVAFWRALRQGGGRGFLAFVDGALVGDMDLRNVSAGAAEFAIMIGDASQKGRGLGKVLAAMLHVFAFRELGLSRVYVQPKRENVRVQRLERALGYEPDDSPAARAYADDEGCLTMSLGAETFRERNVQAYREVEIATCEP